MSLNNHVWGIIDIESTLSRETWGLDKVRLWTDKFSTLTTWLASNLTGNGCFLDIDYEDREGGRGGIIKCDHIKQRDISWWFVIWKWKVVLYGMQLNKGDLIKCISIWREVGLNGYDVTIY